MGNSCTESANSAEVSFGQKCHGHDSVRLNVVFSPHITKDEGRHAAKVIDLQARAGKKRVALFEVFRFHAARRFGIMSEAQPGLPDHIKRQAAPPHQAAGRTGNAAGRGMA